MKRTLMAVGIVVLASMLFMPCDAAGQQWFWPWESPQPFWIALNVNYYGRLNMDSFQSIQFIVRTAFLVILAVVLVNIPWRRIGAKKP
jgi:hypothetical protein